MKNTNIINKVRESFDPNFKVKNKSYSPKQKTSARDVLASHKYESMGNEFLTGRRWPWNYNHIQEYRIFGIGKEYYPEYQRSFYGAFSDCFKIIKVHEENIEWVRGLVKKFLTGVLHGSTIRIDKDDKRRYIKWLYSYFKDNCVLISEAKTPEDYFERFLRGEGTCLHLKTVNRSLSKMKITVELLPQNTEAICRQAVSELQGKTIRWYYIQSSVSHTAASGKVTSLDIYAVHDVRTVLEASETEVISVLRSEVLSVLTNYGINFVYVNVASY